MKIRRKFLTLWLCKNARVLISTLIATSFFLVACTPEMYAFKQNENNWKMADIENYEYTAVVSSEYFAQPYEMATYTVNISNANEYTISDEQGALLEEGVVPEVDELPRSVPLILGGDQIVRIGLANGFLMSFDVALGVVSESLFNSNSFYHPKGASGVTLLAENYDVDYGYPSKMTLIFDTGNASIPFNGFYSIKVIDFKLSD